MQSFYPLRAVHKNGKGYFDFNISDGICPSTTKEFILLNRRGSPILRMNPIFRGTEDGKFFEGDIVISEKEIYCIKFFNEFIAVNAFYRKKLDELVNPVIVGTSVLTDSRYYSNPCKITFKHNGTVFGFGNFGGVVGDKIVINTDGWQRVDPSEIHMSASNLEGRGKLYLNEVIDDKIVTMQNGRILLQNIDSTSSQNISSKLQENPITS